MTFKKLGQSIKFREEIIANGTFELFKNGTFSLPQHIEVLWNVIFLSVIFINNF